MRLDTPDNPNYCATVVRIKNTTKLERLDNVVGASIFGYDVLIGKDTDPLGIFFPAETQLSDAFCYNNNLYRHADKNKYPDQKGYIEDNRRVRAIKFLGNTSNGFYMPIDSLAWTGVDTSQLKEGDEFDTLNGKEICRKYVVKTNTPKTQTQVDRGFVRADKKFMPEHIDTENFFKNADKLDPNAEVIVTQKLHGTSIRIAHTLVNHKPTLVERIASFFGAKIVKHEYAQLYGSRKVIKDANNPNQMHYYDTDIWSTEGKKLDGILPENYLLYAELIGWTPDGAPIQRGYTYAVPQGQCELYVYRIAIINERGLTTDLSWDQVKEFCQKNGLKTTPELGRCKVSFLTENDFQNVKFVMDKRIHEIHKDLRVLFNEDGRYEYINPLWLGDNEDIVDEGICVRIDGLTPKIYKAKSPKFLEHETKLLDTGEEDLESSQNVDYKPVDL